ncbi:hypothetical protein TIFTF001_010019 [Ficus carica]|uniref:CW-type domain-containing protein n=1 Tax=Ficus carica TaxID=3494 RepID=A0AA87ZUR1_FICCA|nr:hypothetical protein TIFTF001_010019 [Ficus carica]
MEEFSGKRLLAQYVGVMKFELLEFYVLPPAEALDSSYAIVAYQAVKSQYIHHGPNPSQLKVDVKERDSALNEDIRSSDHKFLQAVRDHSNLPTAGTSKPEPCAPKQDGFLVKNYARADPSYLKTLGQAHSGWIFGAIAELVDNSRDAKATKLEISVETIYFKKIGKHIPLLSVIDDGHGMTHQDVVIMTSIGHKQPDDDEPERIGRFGVGFKCANTVFGGIGKSKNTGAMRLGKDALVLTQTANSRSIAFLSQSLNEGKDNLEIPIVSYRRQGQVMEVDTSVQSEALAKYNLKAIKEFSPFNKYLIGEKAGLFRERRGTQIYIWNLDEWGSNYSLEWQLGSIGGSSFQKGDIYIRSRRIRSRPSQTSQKVPLDYSLRSYLEVIFLVPRMKIYVQGSLVNSRPLAKFLHKTVVEKGNIMGKHVRLTLGRCQLEWERSNCGIFLYWHGRLIEAYKRVGGMIQSADMGRGVIGVIDVTDLMNDGKGGVLVLNNKQGFQDSESYARLETWLGRKADEYWDKNFDELRVTKKNFHYKPDHEWVQCAKCRKWRMLPPGFDTKSLSLEWFCYMAPFEGSCEIPEEKVQGGVITLSAKRSGYNDDSVSSEPEEDTDDSDPDVKVIYLPLEPPMAIFPTGYKAPRGFYTNGMGMENNIWGGGFYTK